MKRKENLMQEHPKPEHPDNPVPQDDDVPKGPPVHPDDGGSGDPPPPPKH